ncbi:DUF5916 domain-containing protein [Pendulispora albinea]|uniref:Carbohydrate binding family 9 domain-containing protein n=1 Tax=Pendulispora albinea TaxID=2741071 RepID=A0ABZ2M174_9BACT
MYFALASALVFADSIDARAAAPNLGAVRVTEAPVLDGRLDDDAWRAVPGTDAFTQKFPNERSPPRERTIVRVAYDDTALYVAVDCQQRDGRITARLARRDVQVEADWVSVALGTAGDGVTAFEFTVNAAGVQTDMLRYRDTETSLEWDENWEARTTISARGWQAEYRIPFKILRYAILPTQTWRFQVRRYTSERQETDEWAFIPRSGGGEVSRYGLLSGLRDLPRPSQIEARPFVLGRLVRQDAAVESDPSETTLSASAGADVKWHVTPRLTLDATIHPDFAQVEADQLTLNLTNYEVYYPEKRPFFLEGLDIFSLPYQLVYTRRIGHNPLSPFTPNLRTEAPFNEHVAGATTASSLLGAGKLVGKLDDHWSVGTLTALTGANHVDVASNGTRTRRLLTPTTLYNAFRLTRAMGENASVGATVTLTGRAEDAGSYPLAVPSSLPAPVAGTPPPARALGSIAQVLCPHGAIVVQGGRCFNDAVVAGLDWRWRSANGDYVTDGQIYGSMLQNGPPRMALDGTLVRSGDIGAGALFYFGKEGGTHWLWDGALAYSSRKLDINDMGFAQRSNQAMFDGGLEFRELSPWGPLLESHLRLEAYIRQNTDFLDIGRDFQLKTWGRFANFWNAFSSIHYLPARYDDREVGDGTALERAGAIEHEFTLGTNPTKRIVGSLATTTDFVFNGFAISAKANVKLRVLPQFDVELIPNITHTAGEPRWAADDAATGAHVYGRLSASSVGAIVRAAYTFTPRLDLVSYGQFFRSSGHYGDLSMSVLPPGGKVPLSSLVPFTGPDPEADWKEWAVNTNVVLRWEYKLGSTLYLVYSRTQSPGVAVNSGETSGRTPAVDLFMVKLTYWLG